MVMTSEQAKGAALKRWGEKPVRMCEVCGREHRCVKVWVKEGGEEEAIRVLVELFSESVRGVIHVKKEEEKEDEGRMGVGEGEDKES